MNLEQRLEQIERKLDLLLSAVPAPIEKITALKTSAVMKGERFDLAAHLKKNKGRL